MSEFPHFEYTFQDKHLLQNALTHSSYANENRDRGAKSNERLEFLGDSVLGLICARHLYAEYKHLPEGELTKLRAAIVCEGSLHEFALRINLGDRLLLGRGERSGGGNHRASVLADAVEAVLAAVFLDGAKVVDYKTTLQEIVQKNHEETLAYRLKGEFGPDHDKHFVMEVLINSNVVAEGSGKSKKQAEQAAAKAALALMGQ